MPSHKNAKVTVLPDCDLCVDGSLAYADAQLPAIGSWAYVCLAHFMKFRCTLGLGHGQELIIEKVSDANGKREE